MNRRSARRANLAALLVALCTQAVPADTPLNVVFMIGDGMGLEHVRAAGMYLNGSSGTLSFESMPYHAQVTTHSANASVTDSAAASTAMATGNKVNNGVVSLATPGSGAELLSLLEVYKGRGARTGLVTSDIVTGATPAGFGAHESDRNNYSQIAADYLNQARPNVLLGGGGSGMSSSAAISAGYTVVSTRSGMQGVDPNAATLLSGQFGSGSMPYEYDGVGNLPHLSEMTATALDILDNEPNGFFLLVEAGNIDHAAHSNDLARDVFDTIEFHNTVQVALNWAAGRTDTMIIVTADHETGGLQVLQNNGQGNLPSVSWSGTGHTSASVGAWAWGLNAEHVSGTLDNTAFFRIVMGPEPVIDLNTSSINRTVGWAQSSVTADSFTVRNLAMGTLNYSVISDVPWVAPDPATGSCSTETDTIGLVYNTGALAPGEYTARVQVGGPEADNSPQTVTVLLTVAAIPGDFDGDLDVDQEDFGHMQACLAPLDSVPAGCEDANLDGLRGVDGFDLNRFLKCSSAPGVSPDASCVNG